MSSCPVLLTRITKIRPHSDPEVVNLQVCEIDGWQLVIHKGNRYQEGDLVAYVPPDAVVPLWVSEMVEVTNYLSHGRTRCIKLRGEPSYGFTIHRSFCPEHAKEGDDLAGAFGITKYIPGLTRGKGKGQGDAIADNALVQHYTNIENLRHYPRLFEVDEVVVATEKIHGTNCRLAIVDGEQFAGSHRVLRKMPEDEEEANNSLYWTPWSDKAVQSLMHRLSTEHKQVILYGEIFGEGIQKLSYGVKKPEFIAFDLFVDGKYMDFPDFQTLCFIWGVRTAPVVYAGPYSLEAIKDVASGRTLLDSADGLPDERAIREGVVVRPMYERHDSRQGRVILKYVSDEYLTGKFNVDDRDDRAELASVSDRSEISVDSQGA